MWWVRTQLFRRWSIGRYLVYDSYRRWPSRYHNSSTINTCTSCKSYACIRDFSRWVLYSSDTFRPRPFAPILYRTWLEPSRKICLSATLLSIGSKMLPYTVDTWSFSYPYLQTLRWEVGTLGWGSISYLCLLQPHDPSWTEGTSWTFPHWLGPSRSHLRGPTHIHVEGTSILGLLDQIRESGNPGNLKVSFCNRSGRTHRLRWSQPHCDYRNTCHRTFEELPLQSGGPLTPPLVSLAGNYLTFRKYPTLHEIYYKSLSELNQINTSP